MTYKHACFMSVERSEIVEDHGDWVLVTEYLKPDPNGPYWVASDYDEPTWATRTYLRPSSTSTAEHTK